MIDDAHVVQINGGEAIVDKIFAAQIEQRRWQLHISSSGHQYARTHWRSAGKQRSEYLHLCVMRLAGNDRVGRIIFLNKNGLDCRLANLASVSEAAFGYRKSLHGKNTSGVRGVYFNRSTGRWVAQIVADKKHFHLGSYTTLAEAAYVRQQAELRMYGGSDINVAPEYGYELVPHKIRERKR